MQEDLEFDINLADKAAAGLRGRTPVSRSSVDKMLPTSITCYREIVGAQKRQSTQRISLSYFRKWPQHPDLQQPPSWPSTQRQDPPPAKVIAP